MPPLIDRLEALSALARELNAQTDALNETIEALEDELQRAAVGITVWLDQRPEPFSGIAMTRGELGATGWSLGYGKLKDRWRIAVRPLRVEYRDEDEGGDRSHVAGEPSALLEAPRAVRIEAAGHLEDLLGALEQRARELLDGIGEARALVKLGEKAAAEPPQPSDREAKASAALDSLSSVLAAFDNAHSEIDARLRGPYAALEASLQNNSAIEAMRRLHESTAVQIANRLQEGPAAQAIETADRLRALAEPIDVTVRRRRR